MFTGFELATGASGFAECRAARFMCSQLRIAVRLTEGSGSPCRRARVLAFEQEVRLSDLRAWRLDAAHVVYKVRNDLVYPLLLRRREPGRLLEKPHNSFQEGHVFGRNFPGRRVRVSRQGTYRF